MMPDNSIRPKLEWLDMVQSDSEISPHDFKVAAVRAEFPVCDLYTYNHAADEAWKIIQGEAP